MTKKTSKIAITPAMVAAAESAYNQSRIPSGGGENSRQSLEWVFHNRMRAALEAALAEVNHARSSEHDAAMLTTLEVVAQYFEAEGQHKAVELLRMIHHRIASDSAELTTETAEKESHV